MYTYRVWSVAWCLLPVAIMAAPTNIRKRFDFENSTLIYIADHDVTSLGVTLDRCDNLINKIVFFIESGVNEQGERVDYGLYALKDGVKTKLVEEAKDIAVRNLTTAYFATKDGIYYYNKQTNSAEKYGVVNDDVISVDAVSGTGTLYYLNKEHQLYKVTENGNKTTIVDSVKNAQDVMTDHSGHLVYQSVDRSFYVYDGSTNRKIDGIPAETKVSWLVKAPLFVDSLVLLYADDRLYYIGTVNATAQSRDLRADQSAQGLRFTLTAMDASNLLIEYYAMHQKIYEVNIFKIFFEVVFEELRNKLNSVS